MNEIWILIDKFPTYNVSNLGRIMNNTTGRIIRESYRQDKTAKVGLTQGGCQHWRSVHILVGEGFIDGCSDKFDTVVHLDGNRQNNHVENLVWRPRRFALKYSRQFIEISVHHDRGPIIDVDSKEIYATFFEAAIINGILVDDVRRSIYVNKPTFPTQQTFTFIKQV